jgi:glycosyltransferase involved in cell wall biosynthesis
MRIAMIGQRGVPATFGGIEHHVQELGSRLAERGHEITVYTRTNYTRERHDRFLGMRPRYLPTIPSKHLDAIVHSGLATIDAIARRADIVHYHAVGPGLPAVLPRYASRAKVVLTVHGLDADRAKWGGGARRVLRIAQWLSARVPDATIVVSRDLQRHYASAYGRETVYVPNGVAEAPTRPPSEITKRWGLRGNDYVLFVGRLVPEKAPDFLVRAFARVPGDARLVVAGGSSFTDDFVRGLRAVAGGDPRVLLPGYVYGDVLDELYANAAAFALPSLLEGLPLTLLEAASHGVPVVASDIPPHREVIDASAPGHRLLPTGDETAWANELTSVLADGPAYRRGGDALRRRVLSAYRWEDATDATEALYERLRARAPASTG